MFTKSRYKTRLDKLVAEWTTYRELVLTRLGAKDVDVAEERRFMKLKGRLAEEITTVTLNLAPGTAQEVHAHLRAIDHLLNRFPSLMADQPLNERVRAEFDRDWHDHFLFFNRLKSVKPEGRSDMRSQADRYVPPVEKTHRASGGARLTTVLLRLIVLVGLGYVLVRFVPWRQLLSGEATSGEAQSGFDGFVSQAWAGMKSAANDFKMGGVLDPVVAQYGSEATLVLVAVLLLAIGYWIFVRMK
jgi:hypothetical protein